MVLIIIFVAASIAMAVASVRAQMREEKQKQLFRSQFLPYVSDFSTSAYMGRIEQTAVEIMQEAENKPKYQLVLWSGLDGLRLNDDGTSEWIRREEEKKKPVSVSYSPPNQLLSVSRETMQNPFSGCQNITAQINSQIMNQTCQIDNSIRMMQMQIAQNQIASHIQPAYMQTYSPYWQPPYYSAVNQCCARQ